jgi:hypothetical protein
MIWRQSQVLAPTRVTCYSTGNIFPESLAPFDDTQLVSARAPVHDTAAGTVASPGQTEVATLRVFSAPLGTRGGSL